jgi:hypothetical protein
VLDIQGKTRATLRQDAVQLRLLRAQMDKALLPANPNMQEVNGYITQMSQARADMMKTLVAARVQLRQIIGDDNFPAYARFIRSHAGPWFRHAGFFGMRRPAWRGSAGGAGPMRAPLTDPSADGADM